MAANKADDTADNELFWELAEPFMAAGAERSTMMGFPCLRLNDAFFASQEKDTGDLIVKIPADRVTELIESGIAEPFAPAGRKFKEWALIPNRDETLWESLMEEARDFAID